MQDLGELHRKLQEKKRERRDLAKAFKDELEHDPEYTRIVGEMKTLRERKRSIENTARAKALADAERLDALRSEIDGGAELLADVALNRYAANEQVEIVDEDGTRWVPQFKVTFKKDKVSVADEAAAERAASHPERTFAPAGTSAQERELQPA